MSAASVYVASVAWSILEGGNVDATEAQFDTIPRESRVVRQKTSA
jgi:hypothetical protein